MKIPKKRWLGLAFAPALFALIGFASPASAYTCANVPASVSGDLIISESGNCTISHDVTVTNGNIQITSGAAISAQALTTTGGGNILLTATGNVGTNSLTTGDGANTGGIEINANTGGGGGVFNIGAGGANGVNGVLNTSNTSGGGTAPGFIHGGIFITNGNSGSMGGITVSSMSAIQVKASASRSGIINLNAQNGTLTLPAGTLDSIGAAGQGGGSITLLAKTLATGNGTIISASQDYTASGTSHGVTIAAQTVTVTGTGLKIQGDGNGITGSPSTAYATLAPQGSFTLSSNGDVHNLLWTLNSNNFFFVNAALTVSGAAPFTMTADGNYGRVSVTGHPVTFSNKAVTLQSKAATSHEVIIGYNGALTSTLGVGLNGTGTATIDVSAVKRNGDTTANGGSIQLYGDKMTFNSPTLKFLANGPTSGNGDGGTIYISSNSATLKATSKATVSANAASAAAGAGNASANAIIFYPGVASVEVGNDAGQYVFTATGGKKSGNGGNITVNPSTGNINVHNTLATTLPVNVSALGTTGNGGKITLIGNTNVTFAGTAVAIKADGGSTSGNGGEIHIFGNGTINVGSSANAVGLSAKAPGTGNTSANHAGTIEIAYTSALNVDAAAIAVTAAGNAAGGVLNFHDLGQLTLSGTLKADSAGTGKAGSITLSQTAFNPMTLDGSTISASGGCDANGNCGVINISSPVKITAISSTMHADGTAGAKGGQLNIIGNLDLITLDGALLTTSGSQSGADGGIININNNSAAISVAGTNFNANGFVAGGGGQVRITTDPTHPLVANSPGFLIQAKGGDTGQGGIVVIPSIQQLGGGNLFLVNTFIQVGAGSGVTNTSTFGGSVSLNGATCQKTLTTFSYPKSYWNCVHPGSPSAQDAIPAQVASSKLTAGLQSLNANTNLYVLVDAAQFSKFFAPSTAPDVAGFTLSENDTTHLIDVSVFENTTFSTGYASLTTNQLTEVTIHEFGHATDSAAGNVSFNAPFVTAIAKDVAFLNAAGSPCQATGTGPFNGVIDNNTHQQFCSNSGLGGVLNNPGGIYTGKTNSQIAAISTYIFAQNSELYAQSFAYQDFVKTLSLQTGFEFTATANGLFKNGYFQCAQANGASLAGVSYTPQYACN